MAACETFKAAGITPIYGTFKDNWTLGQGMFDYVAGGMLDVGDFFSKLTAQGADISPGCPGVLHQQLRPGPAQDAAAGVLLTERRSQQELR